MHDRSTQIAIGRVRRDGEIAFTSMQVDRLRADENDGVELLPESAESVEEHARASDSTSVRRAAAPRRRSMRSAPTAGAVFQSGPVIGAAGRIYAGSGTARRSPGRSQTWECGAV